jgi:hypothetical protein
MAGSSRASELPFDEEVARAPLQRFDGHLLVDRPGDDHERDVESGPLQHGERRERVEGRHRVVREHQIPGAPLERRLHRLGRVDALVDDVVRPLQLAKHERGVVARVLDEEHTKSFPHPPPNTAPHESVSNGESSSRRPTTTH